MFIPLILCDLLECVVENCDRIICFFIILFAVYCFFILYVAAYMANKVVYNMFPLLLDDALKPATPLIAPLVSSVAKMTSSYRPTSAVK